MKITRTRIKQIIKEEVSRALNETTLEKALRDSGMHNDPVIKISDNQFIQVRPVVRYKGEQPVITSYAVDFGTRVSGGRISGSGMLASSDGSNSSKAIDLALEKIQQYAADGTGPYGTDPIDMGAKVTMLK